MQRMPFVNDIALTTIHGEEIKDEETGKQAVITHLRFLLERIVDPKYVGKREGIEATEYILESRKELRDQESQARMRGHWLIEDERARSLKDVTLHSQYNPRLAHNFYDFMKAAKETEHAPKAVAETAAAATAESNGVAKSEAAQA